MGKTTKKNPEPVAPDAIVEVAATPFETSDGAVPVGPLHLAGIIRTTKGFAVCELVLEPNGDLVSVKVGLSQAFMEFVAIQLKRWYSARVWKI